MLVVSAVNEPYISVYIEHVCYSLIHVLVSNKDERTERKKTHTTNAIFIEFRLQKHCHYENTHSNSRICLFAFYLCINIFVDEWERERDRDGVFLSMLNVGCWNA